MSTGLSQEVRDKGRVEVSMDLLSNAVANLHDRCGLIESRLSSVLAPSKPTATGPIAVPSPSDQSLRGRIEVLAGGIGNATDRLNDLITRLEL